MASSHPAARAALRRGGPLIRWARFAAEHPGKVLLGWVVALALLIGVMAAWGGEFADSFTIPGTESQDAVDLLQERFPSQAGDTAQIVFQSDAGVTDPVVQARIDGFLAEAAALPEVVSVSSPYTSDGVSPDGTIAYSTVQYAVAGSDVAPESFDALTNLIDSSDDDGLRIEAGGSVITSNEIAPPGESELIGIAAAVIILLLTFGSVVAMGLPIVTALIGVGIGFIFTAISAAFLDMATLTTAFTSMIGLGVGIDYALFVVTRFREGRAAGMSVPAAVVQAVDTAGRAVMFAGTIVMIALLGLFAVGIPFVANLGVAGALVVFASVLVAVGLMPALLGLLGTSIDRWRLPVGKHVEVDRTVGSRLTRTIQKKPLAWLGGGLIVTLLLASPVLDVQLGSSDSGNNPEEFRSRRAYDLLAEGFGPGFNGPLVVTFEREGGLDQATLDNLSAAISGTEGVVFTSPAQANEAGDTAVMQVIPSTSPQDIKTEELISTLRDDVIPQALVGSGTHAYVGGATATFVDLGVKISERLPIFILVVIGLSVVVLMAVFRSVLIPLKAAILNLLSFGAAYGVLVSVFQWGWAQDALGIARTGPIESFLPMMLFAILFGLSMDYEVFLVSRIREAYLHDGNTHTALPHGIGATGRVIMAAGGIMVSVFLAFFLDDGRVIKEFGLGLATAIFVDVAIVRFIMVPATMELLGKWNWWFPAWLDRIIPRLDIEGGHAVPEAKPAPVTVAPGALPAD